jgi:hypothetical protein
MLQGALSLVVDQFQGLSDYASGTVVDGTVTWTLVAIGKAAITKATAAPSWATTIGATTADTIATATGTVTWTLTAAQFDDPGQMGLRFFPGSIWRQRKSEEELRVVADRPHRGADFSRKQQTVACDRRRV